MDDLLSGVPVRHMKKTTPGRYGDGEIPENVCEGCLCKHCAADCDMKPKNADCSDVCIGHKYVVTSCTGYIPE